MATVAAGASTLLGLRAWGAQVAAPRVARLGLCGCAGGRATVGVGRLLGARGGDATVDVMLAGQGRAGAAGRPDPIVARLRAAGCVFAEDEARLLREAASDPVELDALVVRRTEGAPLEALLGWAEFCGLRIVVEPGVFVPRQRTAFLVEQAAALAQAGAVVVDLCCGTGAVGAAIADAAPGVEVYAADIEPAAVRCARRNLPPGRVFEGDLYAALPRELRGRVDLLVVNAPYVPTDAIATMPPEARDHEPLVALDGGADGLDVQRRVAADAPSWLRPGGTLLIETGADQASDTASTLAAAGLAPRVIHSEELYATVVIGLLRTPGA